MSGHTPWSVIRDRIRDIDRGNGFTLTKESTMQVTIDQAHFDSLVTTKDIPASPVSGVNCASLDATLTVLNAIATTSGNAWVKMGIGIAITAVNLYKSVHGCP